MDNQENLEEFSLEDILNEFRDPEAVTVEAPAEADPVPAEELAAVEQSVPEEKAADEAEATPEPQDTEPLTETAKEEPAENAVEAAEEPVQEPEETPATEEHPEEVTDEPTRDFSGLVDMLSELNTVDKQATDEATIRLEEPVEMPELECAEEKPVPPPIEFPNRSRLQELKRKLIAGPEKRFYDLTELGVLKLQISIGLSVLIVIMCVAMTTMFTLDMIPANRLRFVIFSQVLAMLVSALLGSQQMLDGLADLMKAKFTISTMLAITFIVCCADAVLCLQELRVPCCAAFAVEMTFALLARYYRRSTEMSQMDTLRKAVQLNSVVKEPDYYNGKPGILRGLGDVDDFMDTYQQPMGPEKVQSVFVFISLILCLGISALAGLRHGPSLAVQVLSTSLLAAVPGSFFISFTRPAALLERRLHLVGSVICGWNGVKKLCGKAAFPIKSEDLFPKGSTKLNGVKFYGDRAPEQVLAYTTSLIDHSGSSLLPIFQNLLNNRGGAKYPVTEYVDYGNGGIGGVINSEAVLMGSLDFMQEMGVEIPQGTMVSQAVYCAIAGQLSAVVAISYAKMRSASAGLISLCAFRRAVPVLVDNDFILTEEFIHSKFGVNTKRMVFPEQEVRAALSQRTVNPESQVLALTTRSDLASTVYTISGSAALRTACRWGLAIHMIGGILGMLIMLALAYMGSTELLTPTNVLLYQLIWMIPGVLVTEWTRTV